MMIKYLCILFACLSLFSEKPGVQIQYPTPEVTNLLFYVQRSLDINTIVYQLNYEKGGAINVTKPVNVYWIKYTEDGQQENLSGLQKKYAYGIKSKLTNAEKKWFTININAYTKMDIYIMNSKSNKTYHAYLKIDGHLAKLTKIFINIDGGSFWNPNVTYIELFGESIATKELVTEKIKP